MEMVFLILSLQVETLIMLEEVMVTGYARSIQNSIETKRNADTVVQAPGGNAASVATLMTSPMVP